MPDKKVGLVNKFAVTRLFDETGKHTQCRYFVLDPQHDPMALTALAMYAKEAREQGYVELADDLKEWIRDIEDAADPERSNR